MNLRSAYDIGRYLSHHIEPLAEACLSIYYAYYPDSPGLANEQVRLKSLQDFRYHVRYLAEAMMAGQVTLFLDYAAWVKMTLRSLGFSDDSILASFQAMKEALGKHAPAEAQPCMHEYLESAILHYHDTPLPDATHLPEGHPLSGLASTYLDLLLAGDRHAASQLIMSEAQSAEKVREIYLHVFQPVLREVGRLWQTNQVSVAQEHYCTASTQLIMSQLYPFIFNTRRTGRSLVAACVGGELHEIGMRMVADFFEMAGWDTYYLGANMPAQAIVRELADRKASILGISATMTYHLELVREMISQVRENAGDRQVKVMVGGQPFNQAPDLWRSIGADGYAANPIEAVKLAESWFTNGNK